MDIAIPYEQVATADEAYIKIKGHITPEYIQKWGVSSKMEYDDVNKVIISKGKGFELKMDFQETECHVHLEVGFLMKAIKGKVLGFIEAELKKGV